MPAHGLCSVCPLHLRPSNCLMISGLLVSIFHGFLIGLPSTIDLRPTMHPSKETACNWRSLISLTTFESFQYLQFPGHSMAIKLLFFLARMAIASKFFHNRLKMRMCPLCLAAPPGRVTFTDCQEQPPVQGIEAQSKARGLDIKPSARITAACEVPSSVIVVRWQPQPLEKGEEPEEISDE